MNISIRTETSADHSVVFDLIEKAFSVEEMSDHKEQFLVERLRASSAFVPELSLVAEREKDEQSEQSCVVGHILLTKIHIINDQECIESLALAPVSVLPDYQREGIGGLLIESAHQLAAGLGFQSVVLLGHAAYYPRFGYRPTADFGIQLPFDVPAENCMVLELVENALEGVTGVVEYPPEFFGD